MSTGDDLEKGSASEAPSQNSRSSKPQENTNDYYQHESHSSDNSRDTPDGNRREAIKFLYRVNMLHAEMVLYQDAIIGDVKKSSLRTQYWEDLHQHLDRYAHASKLYRHFDPSLEEEPGDDLTDMAAKRARREYKADSSSISLVDDPIEEAAICLSNYSEWTSRRLDACALEWLGNTGRRDKSRRERVQKERKKFYGNLGFAVAGGFALVVPMLIMTLHATLLTSLVTTSVFVFAAAVILAAVMEGAEPKDIVGSTAAYAAVLVVFVGTSGGTSSGKGGPSAGTIAGIVVGALTGGGVLVLVYACLDSTSVRRELSRLSQLRSGRSRDDLSEHFRREAFFNVGLEVNSTTAPMTSDAEDPNLADGPAQSGSRSRQASTENNATPLKPDVQCTCHKGDISQHRT